MATMVLASAGVLAGTSEYDGEQDTAGQMPSADASRSSIAQEPTGPAEDVQESAKVLQQLKEQDPELAARMADAKAVFVIPDYVTAALLAGGSGGEGVLLTSHDGQWGSPGFYDIGNIDIGVQAGVAAGSVVMMLMTDDALDNFGTETSFELTTQAGLTLVNWSADAASTSSDADVLVWSDTEGLLAEASVGVGGISWDEDEAAEYYQAESVTAEDVLAGNIPNPNESELQSEFAEFNTGTTATEPATPDTP
jgi:lipid-binding SYLF domain-containing protein